MLIPASPPSQVSCDPAYVTFLLIPAPPPSQVHDSRLAFHGFSWFFMVFHSFSWFFMVFHGFSWFLMVFHVPGWFFMVFHGSRLVFHGFSWLQVGFSWFFSKMYPPKLYPGPMIQSRSAARRAAQDLVQSNGYSLACVAREHCLQEEVQDEDRGVFDNSDRQLSGQVLDNCFSRTQDPTHTRHHCCKLPGHVRKDLKESRWQRRVLLRTMGRRRDLSCFSILPQARQCCSLSSRNWAFPG